MGSNESACVCERERKGERAPKILMRDAGAVGNVIRSVRRGRVDTRQTTTKYKSKRVPGKKRRAVVPQQRQDKPSLTLWGDKTTAESLAGTGGGSVNTLYRCGAIPEAGAMTQTLDQWLAHPVTAWSAAGQQWWSSDQWPQQNQRRWPRPKVDPQTKSRPPGLDREQQTKTSRSNCVSDLK